MKNYTEHLDELVLLPERRELQHSGNFALNVERNWRSEGQQRRRERERNERSVANRVHALQPAHSRGKLLI